MNFTVRQSASVYFLVVLALLAVGVAAFATSYIWLSPENFSFAQQRQVYALRIVPLTAHVLFGSVALVLGAVQFFTSIRNQRIVHRSLGMLYIGSVLVGGLSGFVVATFAYGGGSNTAAFTFLSALWLYTTGRALWHVRRKDYLEHQRWMIRSYALTFAAVTLRMQLGLLVPVGGVAFDTAYLIVPWSSWVLNLLIAEWFILPKTLASSSAKVSTVQSYQE